MIIFQELVLLGKTFKNIQVLTDIKTDHAMYEYMAKLNMELGIQCNYCHDLSDYSADHEKKAITRDMIRMVNEINGKWFSKEGAQQVTCWTCHQGAPEVETEM